MLEIESRHLTWVGPKSQELHGRFLLKFFFFNLLSYHNKLMVTILTFDRFQNCFQHLCYALTIGGKRRLFGKLLSWFVGHCLNKRPWNTIWMATSTTYILIEKKIILVTLISTSIPIVWSTISQDLFEFLVELPCLWAWVSFFPLRLYSVW